MNPFSLAQSPDRDRLAGLGFYDPGSGPALRKCEITVYIVARRQPLWRVSYGVYLRHAAPADGFWRATPPLLECHTLEEAQGVADKLYGVPGAGPLAQLVVATQHFL